MKKAFFGLIFLMFYQLIVAQNVGIGITTPQDKLDVNGTARLTGGSRVLKFETNLANSTILRYAPAISFIRTNGTEIGRIEYVDTFSFSNFIRMRMGDIITNGITLNEDNHVGISTADPLARLHIRGASGIDEIAMNSGAISESSTIQFYNTFVGGIPTNKLAFIQNDGLDLRLGTNSGNENGRTIIRMAGTDRILIDSTGNLQVLGLQDASLTSHGYLMLGSVSGSNLILDNNEIMARGANGTAGNLVIQNDGGTVRIGNVGVPSGYRFAVDGKVICEELKVQLSGSWPDYVFSHNYKLRPLSELNQFIQNNKHLPGIPAASEIEKNGVAIGDMQRRVVEKIEELTLYILDLQKQIDALKKVAK